MYLNLKCLSVFCVFALLMPVYAHAKCTMIYYDSVPKESGYTAGSTASMLLENLLGHFPEVQKRSGPIESYQAGDLEKCESNFYVGTYFDNALPGSFLSDVVSTKKRFTWIGYNFWQLGDENLAGVWGVKFNGLSSPEQVAFPVEPGFYKFIEYKGETFEKFGQYNTDKVFESAQEIALFEKSKNSSNEFIALARHSKNGNTTPYVVRSKTKWLIADLPFSYVTPDDRYLVFADLLFDVLEAAPRWGKKHPGLVRLEDLHAKVPVFQAKAMVEKFTSNQMPFSVSLIPVFRDPLMSIVTDPKEKEISMSQVPELVKVIKDSALASVLMHGVTHQYNDVKNPLNGVSGPDYEFWDDVNKKAIPEDSADYVVKRLEWGLKEMELAGLKPVAWVTPHYTSSLLDQVIFGQLFTWHIGRARYTPGIKIQPQELPQSLKFDRSTSAQNGKRIKYFRHLQVATETLKLEGQFFPYEIYRDALGSAFLPENIGFLEVDANGKTNVDVMLARMKRNLVLRDTWASFFIHPYLHESDEAHHVRGAHHEMIWSTFLWNSERKGEIDRLLAQAKSLGYEFVDLKNWKP